MVDSERKVVAFIVEGISDEVALGSIMSEYFSNSEVRFVIVRGDITVRDYVTVDSIVKKVNEQIDIIKTRYRYENEHFLKIIHITDTDGAFVDENLVEYAEVDKIKYYEDHIVSSNPEYVIDRNKRKADILFKLRKTGKIQGIPYRIYFNSCNLEHVLYGELKDFSDEEKEEMSDAFAEKYEDDVEGFIKFINSLEIAVPGTYQEGWKYIEKENRSLQRYSNMHMIFE